MSNNNKSDDNIHISDSQITDWLSKNQGNSERILEDPDKLTKLLTKAEKCLSEIPRVGTDLAYIPLFIEMVRAYAKGEYKEIPLRSIIAIVSGLLYLVIPTDLIPDAIPGIGYIDDVAVIAFITRGIIITTRKTGGLLMPYKGVLRAALYVL